MLELSHARLDRLKGMRTLFRFLLVAPTRRSLRLFSILIEELDSMILEWETDLQLASLVLTKRASTVNPPSDDGDHDGDHPVENQMPDEWPGRSAGFMK